MDGKSLMIGDWVTFKDCQYENPIPICEAILFEWKDAADLARKTLLQIKAREE